ncbi:EAL domain-containing protein [Aquipseudomonas campi]|uniref:EAL domain-containing protein n=1 Tax=Aquipseudomonas campi TaxID=2731681 RepID=A0A6M8FWG4_9GAMM|nr:EAL domain-containing protein [Pseudomonas campi]QKE65238.1 EAL domain-containing protein [Pseudomonas campi]
MPLNRAFNILVAVLVACLSLKALAQPEPIEVTAASSIQAHFEFWEDATGEALIDQVVALPDERWSLVPTGSASFGLTPSAYWLRFTISNQTPLNLNLIAELGYSQLDDVAFYAYAGGALVKELKTGDSRPFYPRDVDHPSMSLGVSLAPEEMKTVFVRVATGGSMIVPLRIWREQAFFEAAADELKLHFFYYGCIFVIILINLAVYLSLREKLYLYYALALFGYLLFFASIKGFSFQHLYPYAPQLHAKALLVSIPGLALFSLLFCREFLNTRLHSPRLDKVLIGMMVFELLFLLSAPLMDYHTGVQVASFSALFFFSLLLVAGPVVWKQGVRAGGFFTLAWTPLTIGVLATAGRALGIFPEHFFTAHAMQIGSGLEAFILTLALADRLYREREDKITAHATALQEAQARNIAQNLLTEALAHDPVSGLPNRNRFEWMVDQQLKQAPNGRYMVGLARITRLDEINRTLGLARSEWIMKQVAKKMVELAAGLPFIQAVRDDHGREERVYRISGDCFCLLVDVDKAANDFSALNTVLRQLAEPIWLDHLAIELHPRFGAASYPEHGKSAAELIRNAHVGMEITPRDGNETGIYSPKYDIYNESRLTLIADLRKALLQNQLMLYYQPKQDLLAGHIVGVEALIRWHHEERGWVSPADFIPLAEETGVITQLTKWVIGQAMKDLADLHTDNPELTLAINISARDLESAELKGVLELELQKHGLQARSVTLEITETAAMLDPARSLQALNVLAEQGYQISIDDFGSGYSSLSYLKQLPASELKLDRSLIHDICTNESADVIVSTAIQMARSLGYRVVGEGIETAETASHLQAKGCDLLQGFWLCKPTPITGLKPWLQNFKAEGRAARSLPL